jgi:diadenosine tetraphosphate (Ap4A) HIT family hydrolase
MHSSDKTMAGCTFCRILSGELPSTIVYRDDLVTRSATFLRAVPS